MRVGFWRFGAGICEGVVCGFWQWILVVTSSMVLEEGRKEGVGLKRDLGLRLGGEIEGCSFGVFARIAARF